MKAQAESSAESAQLAAEQRVQAHAAVTAEAAQLRQEIATSYARREATVNEAAELHARCQRSEDQVSALTAQNQRLTESLALALTPANTKPRETKAKRA